jgi:hypothetical protein
MRRLVASFVALAAAVPIAAAAPKPGAFTLAVLRHDGRMTPFASFDGRNWAAPWPVRILPETVLPIAIGDVPAKWWGATGPAATWRALVPDEQPRPLKLLDPEVVPVFCSHQLQIRTDYPGAPLDPREKTAPKDGLAVAGDVTIHPLPATSIHTVDASQYVSAITDEFNREETLATQRFYNWKHPYSEEQRKTFPIALEALYRHTETTARGTWTTAYVEAVRKFPERPQDRGCGLITFVRGWVIDRPGQAKPTVNIGARVTYCDRANVTFMLPFGEVVADGEAYWIYQMSSWTDELYSVTRVRPDGIKPTVVIEGGFCNLAKGGE